LQLALRPMGHDVNGEWAEWEGQTLASLATHQLTSGEYASLSTLVDVLIPYEISAREWPGALLLACALVGRGASVAIGPKNSGLMCPDETSVRAQAFFYKFGSGPFRSVAPMGFGQDPEAGLVFQEAADFISLQRKGFLAAVEAGSTYFAYGEDDFEAIHSDFGDALHCVMTGSPRAQVWKESGSFYASERAEIRRKYGDFMLLASTEAGSSPVKRRHMPAEPVRAQSEEVWRGHARAAQFLAQSFPDLRIVVRPHPAEDKTRWNQIASITKNIFVDGRFTAQPWLEECVVLLQNGSTTAVEAAVIGKPVINYGEVLSHVAEGEKYVRQVPRLISVDAIGLEQIEQAVHDAIGNLTPASQSAILGRKLHWPESGSAEAISAVIETQFPAGFLSPTDVRMSHHLGCARRRRRDHKLAPVSTRRCQRDIEGLAHLAPGARSIAVQSIGHGSHVLKSYN